MGIIVGLVALPLCIYLVLKKPAVAVITAPFIAGIVLLIGVREDSVAAVLIAASDFIFTMILVAAERSDELADRWPRKWAIAILLTALVIGIFIGGAILFQALSLFFFVPFIILIAMFIGFAITSRDAVASYIISTISASIRQNLPLATALEAAAGIQKDERARALRRISKWLVEGYSLNEAVKRGYPKCPGYVIAMIAAAQRVNQLPSAMKSIEADIVAKADQSRRHQPYYPLYPLILMTILTLITVGLLKFVVPKFTEVLSDMGVPLPKATMNLIAAAQIFYGNQGTVMFLSAGCFLLIAIPVSLRVKFRPRRPEKPYLISRIGDFIKWHLPILHWFEFNYSMVHTVELLRVLLEAGLTINEALAAALHLDINNHFRNRLSDWLQKIEQGENIADAARQCGLGNALAWAFDAGINQGNTLGILETLESFYRTNYNYRINLARFILYPTANIAIGIMVGCVVYAIFLPIVTITNHLITLILP